MNILGINNSHNASACILQDGKLLSAIEEDRLNRIKHWKGFPVEAIRFCLKEAQISVSDIDAITIGWNPQANLLEKISFVFKYRILIPSALRKNRKFRIGTISKLEFANFLKAPVKQISAQIYPVEHHTAHLASAFFASPFEKAGIISIDGYGDFCSTKTAIGIGNKIKILDTIPFQHSLGIFYRAFTQFLGFENFGDEYKVMGLAAYGKPIYLKEMRAVIRLTNNGLFHLTEKYFNHIYGDSRIIKEKPKVVHLYSDYFIKQFGAPRKSQEELTTYHKDLAASVQKITEETIFHVLNQLYKKTKTDTLCIAGGVAQNSLANGKIYLNTPFKKIYIPPAAHDGGLSIGSALYLHHHIMNQQRTRPMLSSSIGSKFSNEEIGNILQEQNFSYQKFCDDELFDKITDCLINGGVVGWFQGRAEFGPRALGHRSILADPRRDDVKELLNLKIKKRELFRPFAPSVMKEFVSEYFELNEDVPFMEKVFKIKEEKRKIIPAVTHIDGTGRLQSVDAVYEPKFHSLILKFYNKTNVPVLLNTSFNENEPIVNTPQEALDCFLRTQMDMLAMENCLVIKSATGKYIE